MPLLTDLRELKSILEIDPQDTSEDKKLLFLIEMASGWIEEYLNRTGKIFAKSRTMFLNGTGTQKLLLPARPVYATPTPTVIVDNNGYYGSTSGSFDSNNALTYGTDFCLAIDQDDGLTSRSGILIRIGNLWDRPAYRQGGLLSPFIGDATGNVKVTWVGGWYLDNLPAPIRLAMTTLVAAMRHLFPLGFLLSSENYEERGISLLIPKKRYLMGLIEGMIMGYRNYKW